MENQLPEVSSKNTKNEILEAYESLLKQVHDTKQNAPKQIQEEKQKEAAVKKVENVSQNGILDEITNLKSLMQKSLEKLQAELMQEYTKLEEIRKAQAIEKQNLEDLYSLSATTDSLAAMILAQKERKEQFEKEMQKQKEDFETDIKAQRTKWQQEKEKHEQDWKELQEQTKKARQREEDEYQYNLKINRKKEQDAYDTKKNALEKELYESKLNFELEISKRQTELSHAEAELKELRKNSEDFPQKMEKTLKDQEKQLVQQLTQKYEFESKLLAKQVEGDLKLKTQSIELLREKIAEMQIQMKELTDKANKAENSVKDIAVKAIESSSKFQVLQSKDKDSVN